MSRSIPFVARLAIVSLTGIAFGAAAPASPLSALDWIALVPLLAVLRATRPSAREALALGLCAGVGVGAVGFSWIADFLQNFAGFPRWLGLVGMFLFALWMAVPYAAFACGTALGPRRGALSFLWPIVLFSAALELWPVVFPYTPAIGLVSVPEWIQIAELGGVRLIEAQIVLSALLAVRALIPDVRGSAPRALYAGAALALPLASWGLGALRIEQVERETSGAPRVRVGIVQPNVPAEFEDREESVRRLRTESLRAEAEGAELVIWPEAGTYPYAWRRPLERDMDTPRAQVNVERKTPTLFGVISYERDNPDPYNTIVYLAPDGRVRGVFDKVELLVFGEYVPLIDYQVAKALLPTLGQLSRGAGPVRFDVELAGGRSVAVGPLVCYEDILPEFARRVAAQPQGIELFVNATVDAWYGEGNEPWEHLALAQIRSVEHRIPLVRAVSTGVSAVVDATGRMSAYLPPRITPPGAEKPRFDSQVLVADVTLARTSVERPTVFARVGWRYPWLCTIASLAGALACAVGAWRRRASEAQPDAVSST